MFSVKTLSIIGIIGLCSAVNAQLPVINAETYGDNKYVDWQAEKRAAENEEGPGFFYNDCAQGVEAVSATSTLAPQGKYKYSIKNLTDFDPMTAWVEGAKGYGIGESFTIKAVTVNTIYNGYQHSTQVWKDNSRVKKFKVYKDGEALCFLILKDVMGSQHFDLPGEMGNWDSMREFKFEIVDVHKGLKWDDVCISHIDWVACCMSGETSILGSETSLAQLSEGATVTSLNLEKEELNNSEVIKTTAQPHVGLIEIRTENHSLQMTKDHPVYVEGVGFTSLNRLASMKQISLQDLAGKISILTWNDAEKAKKFEKLRSIELLEGVQMTYAVRELSENEVIIANGFITKVY